MVPPRAVYVAMAPDSLASTGLAGIEGCVLRTEPTRQSEVENLYQSAVSEHYVLRLQVAVKDAERVRGLQTVGNLDADRKQQLQTGGPLGDELLERLARHILHGDVSFVAALAHFVNAANVGVLDGRCHARLAQHGVPHLLRGEQAGAQDL